MLTSSVKGLLNRQG